MRQIMLEIRWRCGSTRYPVAAPRQNPNRRHYVIDWNFDEDRSRIRTGYGPENITRLRRFVVGVLNLVGNKKTSIAEKMAKLNRNTRLVFDYLRMTKNSIGKAGA